MQANYYTDATGWNYLSKLDEQLSSIGIRRLAWLRELNERSGNTMLFATFDRTAPEDFQWTKWRPWYGGAQKPGFAIEECLWAYDIHRSILPNEIIIESDYPTYAENAEAARLICQILERREFIPHIYYSGSKSVHVHIYLGNAAFSHIDQYVITKIKEQFTPNKFKKDFMEWLRDQMISCFGIGARKFDEQLVKATHLIRAELSKNKLGYKTFLGHTWRDIPPFPIICNEETGITPELGDLRLSTPPMQELLEEFLASVEQKMKKRKARRREQALTEFFQQDDGLKGCIKFILSPDFQSAADGQHRAMFFLYNELYKAEGDAALHRVLAWNEALGNPIREQEITYRFAQGSTYNLSHQTIHEFLRNIGFKEADDLCLKFAQDNQEQGLNKEAPLLTTSPTRDGDIP